MADYRVVFTRSARKELEKLPPTTADSRNRYGRAPGGRPEAGERTETTRRGGSLGAFEWGTIGLSTPSTMLNTSSTFAWFDTGRMPIDSADA